MKSRILPFCLAFFLLFPALPVHAENPVSPTVSAQSAVLWECSRGEVVYGKNSTTRLPMASTTKIMTALVAIEQGDPAQLYAIPAEACGVEGSSVYLRAGELLTLEELLYAVLLQSANDAAAAVAYIVGGDIPSFADLMNEKAAELGLADTHFTNPHGLDHEEHYTTALDLAKLASYALENPTFAKIVSTHKTTIPLGCFPVTEEKIDPVENYPLSDPEIPTTTEGTRVLVNHNRLLRQYPDIIGVKTGFTKRSGRCLVSAAEQNGVRLVAVTLNAPDDWRDHRTLLDEGFTQYESVTLAEPSGFVADIPCACGKLTAVNRDGLRVVLPVGTEVHHVVESMGLWFAPIEAGEPVATVRFTVGENEVGTLVLYAAEGIDAGEK